jgi:hypothetical protein
MASDARWIKLKVSLVSGRGEAFEPAPGRVMIAAPEHTLAELAEAIDLGFARWDHSHLHLFRLPDGRALMSGEEFARADESDGGTDRSTLGSLGLKPGQRFEYVFDMGDDWTHVCEVLAVDADPEEEYGIVPEDPVPIEGWGWIPDQYGREAELVEE